MPFLGKSPTAGFASIVKDDLTPNGSTTAFTLSKQVANANDIAVFLGNVRQEPTDAYTVSGTTLTMSEAPASGLNFYVLHIAGTIESSVVPADNTISTAKLQNDSVTGAKIENNPTIAGTLTSTGLITASAGVAIGGTGAANTLDDYEKGDWTPVLKVNGSAPTGINYHYREGRYRKIGSVCHVHWRLEIDTKGSTSSGAMTITDLPFSISENYPIGVIGAQTMTAAFSNFPGSATSQGLWALGAGTVVYLRYNTTTGYGDWNWSAVPSQGINIWGSMTFNVT